MRHLTVSTLLRVITAGLLVYALFSSSYDFFAILKIAVCLTSGYMIYAAIITKNFSWIVLMVTLIILFNPFTRFPIKRETWAIIDVATAVIMLGSVFLLGEKLKKEVPSGY